LLAMASLLGVVALMLFGSESGWRSTGPFGWPVNAFVLSLLAASIASSELCARLLSARWLAYIGTISYGIYLWHDLVLRVVFRNTLRNALGGWPLFVIGGLLALAVTVLIATLSWYWIERRALKLPYPRRR
jgi:peptidoglycan/LPS O-acetylase OafA/YrhL